MTTFPHVLRPFPLILIVRWSMLRRYSQLPTVAGTEAYNVRLSYNLLQAIQISFGMPFYRPLSELCLFIFVGTLPFNDDHWLTLLKSLLLLCVRFNPCFLVSNLVRVKIAEFLITVIDQQPASPIFQPERIVRHPVRREQSSIPARQNLDPYLATNKISVCGIARYENKVPVPPGSFPYAWMRRFSSHTSQPRSIYRAKRACCTSQTLRDVVQQDDKSPQFSCSSCKKRGKSEVGLCCTRYPFFLLSFMIPYCTRLRLSDPDPKTHPEHCFLRLHLGASIFEASNSYGICVKQLPRPFPDLWAATDHGYTNEMNCLSWVRYWPM